MNRRSTFAALRAVAGFSAILLMAGSAALAQQSQPKMRNIVRTKLPQNVNAVALSYEVLLAKDGNEKPVDAETYDFDVGDQFVVRIKPESDMYVYIYTEGPTGERACLLPDSESMEQAPMVKAGDVIELPNDGYFQFDLPPGEEKLIVVATTEPSTDLMALNSVVFRKPDSLLSDTEKAEKKKLLGQYEQKLNSSIKQKLAGAKTRGVLTEKSLAEFSTELKSKGMGTIVEQPHGAETSTFAMAVATPESGKPELVQYITLRSKDKDGN